MLDYRIKLDVYHGPLDLLLYLIKRHEIDIQNIAIAPITEQYLAYVASLKDLDVNLAGDFLVMAATLMEIKSAMLAPRPAGEGESGEESEADALSAAENPADPRYELVQQLLAYKRFKDAATALDRRREQFEARFPRRPAPFERDAPESADAAPELDLEDASIWQLLEAYNRLVEQIGHPPRVEFAYDETPIELHEADILDRLQRDGSMTLQQMFIGRSRGEPLGMFLALLELLRQRKVAALQDRIAGEIHLSVRPQSEWQSAEADESPGTKKIAYDPNNPAHFDWPDDATRARYARRIERRLRGEFITEDAEFEEDIKAMEAEETGGAAPPAASGEGG